MAKETLEQFLQRARRIGFHPESVIRILGWKFKMPRAEAEKVLTSAASAAA